MIHAMTAATDLKLLKCHWAYDVLDFTFNTRKMQLVPKGYFSILCGWGLVNGIIRNFKWKLVWGFFFLLAKFDRPYSVYIIN